MIYYNGDHSITFIKKEDDELPIYHYLENFEEFHNKNLIKNTWSDWKLIPLNQNIITPPLKKKSVVDLPGSNGHIDLSNVITGYPLYSNRTGSFEFYVANANIYELGNEGWPKIYSDILNFFNDSNIVMILDDDKFFYYEGNFYLTGFNSDKSMSKLTIEYDLYPYKQSTVSSFDSDETSKEWLWNPFDFYTGYIQESYNKKDNLIQNGSKMIIICGNEPKIIELSFFDPVDNPVITIKCNNRDLNSGSILSTETNIYNSETEKILFNDLSKNINVEKEFIFDFNNSGSIKVEIKYYGGFL